MSEVVHHYCLRDEDGNQVLIKGDIVCPCADGVGTLFTSHSQAKAAALRLLELRPEVRLIVARSTIRTEPPVPPPRPPDIQFRKFRRKDG